MIEIVTGALGALACVYVWRWLYRAAVEDRGGTVRTRATVRRLRRRP